MTPKPQKSKRIIQNAKIEIAFILVFIGLTLISHYYATNFHKLEEKYCELHKAGLMPHDGEKIYIESRLDFADVCCVKYNIYENLTQSAMRDIGFGWRKKCIWVK